MQSKIQREVKWICNEGRDNRRKQFKLVLFKLCYDNVGNRFFDVCQVNQILEVGRKVGI